MMAEVLERGGSLLNPGRLTPRVLFSYLFRAGRKVSQSGLETCLANSLSRSAHTDSVVRLFVEDPSRVIRIRELCLALGIQNATASRVVAKLGFYRAEHLITFLRAEAWAWFVSRGLNRRIVEEFLGITDRSNFRRACQRAHIHPPWHLARQA
jgi:hypothetical protein